VNSLALIAVGLMNIIAVINSTNVFRVVFGVMRIGWGFAEIRKFKLVQV